MQARYLGITVIPREWLCTGAHGMGSDCYAKFWKVNKVHLFMLSMKMVNGKTGKYLSYIQWNLSTMATMGTEESGHYNEVAAVKRLKKSQ